MAADFRFFFPQGASVEVDRRVLTKGPKSAGRRWQGRTYAVCELTKPNYVQDYRLDSKCEVSAGRADTEQADTEQMKTLAAGSVQHHQHERQEDIRAEGAVSYWRLATGWP